MIISGEIDAVGNLTQRSEYPVLLHKTQNYPMIRISRILNITQGKSRKSASTGCSAGQRYIHRTRSIRLNHPSGIATSRAFEGACEYIYRTLAGAFDSRSLHRYRHHTIGVVAAPRQRRDRTRGGRNPAPEQSAGRPANQPARQPPASRACAFHRGKSMAAVIRTRVIQSRGRRRTRHGV